MTARRIVGVHLYDDFSGSAKVFAHALSELAASGAELRIVVGADGETGFVRAAHRAETVYYRFQENRLLLLFNFALAQLLIFLRVLRLCLFWGADIVYANTVLTPGAVLAGRLCRRRVVVHVHEVGLGSRALFRVLLSITTTAAHRVLCVSRYVREVLRLDPNRSIVVYNSLPTKEWHAALAIAESRHEDPGAPFVVFMACSLKWYKGLDSYLALAARSEAQSTASGRRVRYCLALNCAPEEWRGYAAAHSPPANLEVVLRPTDIYKHYQQAGLVLNLSHPEGWVETFGMTLLEAMACGVPVVCPRVGGCTELFAESQGGWLACSRDLATLERIIESLARDPALLADARRDARENAAAFAPERFSANLLGAVLRE